MCELYLVRLRYVLRICYLFLAIVEYKSEKRSILSVFLTYGPASFNMYFVKSQIHLEILRVKLCPEFLPVLPVPRSLTKGSREDVVKQIINDRIKKGEDNPDTSTIQLKNITYQPRL